MDLLEDSMFYYLLVSCCQVYLAWGFPSFLMLVFLYRIALMPS